MTDSMDRVFHALAHSGRRRILDIVKDRPGTTVRDVAVEFEISRVGVLKHINVLEDAELLVSVKRGRERRLHFNSVPIQMIHDRWSSEYSALWAGRLTRLKYRLENQEEAT